MPTLHENKKTEENQEKIERFGGEAHIPIFTQALANGAHRKEQSEIKARRGDRRTRSEEKETNLGDAY